MNGPQREPWHCGKQRQVSQDGQAHKESVYSAKKVDRKLERPRAGTATRSLNDRRVTNGDMTQRKAESEQAVLVADFTS